MFCRCLEALWALCTLEERPDIGSVGNFMKKVDEMKVEYTMSWDSVGAMGYASYSEGRCEMIEAPLYRSVFLKPFSRANISGGSSEILFGEISDSLKKNGGHIVVGCDPVEEQWNCFAFEAWQSFDGT